jgi:hypothetical protein
MTLLRALTGGLECFFLFFAFDQVSRVHRILLICPVRLLALHPQFSTVVAVLAKHGLDCEPVSDMPLDRGVEAPQNSPHSSPSQGMAKPFP